MARPSRVNPKTAPSQRFPLWHWVLFLLALMAAGASTLTALGAFIFFWTRPGAEPGPPVAEVRPNPDKPGPKPDPDKPRPDPVNPNPDPTPPKPPVEADVDIASVAIPELKVDEAVYLDPAPLLTKFDARVSYSVLRRELLRQAFLMAARDELGLPTRDGALREPVPEGLAASHRFQVASTLISRAGSVQVDVGEGAARKTELKKDVPYDENPLPAPYGKTIEAAETLSRREFADLLRKSGFKPQAPAFRSDAPVPAGTERLLGEMTVLSQFAAVRQLHAYIRAKGESPALLGALVRAYAHLGVLTEHLWTVDHKVYKARSLLYAERLRQKVPKEPTGYWHRAYAKALATLHAEADQDLKLAKQVTGTKAVPQWVALLDPCIRFDAAALAALAAKPEVARTAQLLHYFAVEDNVGTELTFQVGDTVVAANPACTRVLSFSAAFGNVGHKHKSTEAYLGAGKVLTNSFASLPRLPGSVTEVLGQPAPETKLPRVLREAGKGDGGELNWAGLGYYLLEERFLAAYHRTRFMRDQWGVPIADYVAEAMPTLEDHRYRDLLQLLQMDAFANQAAFRDVAMKISIDDVDVRCYEWVHGMLPLSGNLAHAGIAVERSLLTTDLTYRDQVLTYIHGRGVLAPIMRDISHHGPYGISLGLEGRSKVFDSDLERWEKEELHQAAVLRGFGTYYARRKDPAKAERYLRAYLEKSPDAIGYKNLAEMFKAQGKIDQWLATLEEFLKQPVQDLSHAQLRVEIANHLMELGKYKEAEPYAAKAAETFAAWAMVCAIDCYEGLEDWEKAELWVHRLSERYPPQRFDWALWCKRTGKGDWDAARELADAHVKASGGKLSRTEAVYVGVLQLLSAKPDLAAETFGQLHRTGRSDAQSMLYAFACDQAGMKEQRDEVWKNYPNKQGPFAELAAMFRDSGDKDFDIPAAEKIVTPMRGYPKVEACYFVGRFLESRGKAKEATAFYQRCAAEHYASPEFRTLACERLRSMGVQPQPRGPKPIP